MSDSPDHLRSIVDRILRCREDEDEAKLATKDVYAEARSMGFDKTALGKLVAELRARTKDGDKLDEQEAMLDLYRERYHGASHVHTRERDAA